MELYATGFMRDHGTKLLFNLPIAEMPVSASTRHLTRADPLFQLKVESGEGGPQITGALVSAVVGMRMSGDYMMQIEITKEEIARLFYLTHRRDLDPLFDIIGQARREPETD